MTGLLGSINLMSKQAIMNKFHLDKAKPRTPQDMDGTLTLIFAKLETS